MDIATYIEEPLPFEKEITSLFNTKDKLMIFDIGSCEGEDTIRLKKLFPNAIVYSFEPLPKNIQKIKRNFKRFNHPENHLMQVALSSKNGEAEFHISSGHPDELPKTKSWDYGNKSSSLLPPKEHKKTHKWLKFDEVICVKTQRLDDFCKKNSIDRIDFVYMDVQGAELMVLKGAGNFLNKVSLIWMEVEAIELYKGQPLKNDVEKFMKDQGFYCIKSTVDDIAGDQLYVNERFLPKGYLRSLVSRIANRLR